MQEARELVNDPSEDYSAAPLEVGILVSIILLEVDFETLVG